MREPLDLEFDYFGETIRIHPQATDAVEMEFLRAGEEVDLSVFDGVDLSKVDAVDPEKLAGAVKAMNQILRAGVQAALDALRQLIHPEDFDRYWRIGMQHGQQIRDRMTDIRAITTAVVEATTDFPTGRLAASPTGPGATPPGSTAGSPSPAPASDLEVALALERGRPDIQEFYVMQAEDKARAAQEERENAARDKRQLATAGLA
ncbi:hypothetical protein ACWD6N_03470 [Micromonospora sp. NPDC005163]